MPTKKAIPKELFPIINIQTIQYIVEEAVNSGIKEIILVISSSRYGILGRYVLKQNIFKSIKMNKKDKSGEIQIINALKIKKKYLCMQFYRHLLWFRK